MSALDIITELSNCWCEALATTIGGSPAQCCPVASVPVIADCCAGTAWVRLIGAYPSVNFPSQASSPQNCRVDTWALQVEIGIARCAPQPCEVTGPVCCEEDILALQSQISDFEAMRRVFSCCLTGVRQDEIIVGAYEVDDLGGCSSATMQATIRLSDSCAC